jgi:hypothetical protein
MRVIMRTIATLSVMSGVLFGGGIAPFLYFVGAEQSALCEGGVGFVKR